VGGRPRRSIPGAARGRGWPVLRLAVPTAVADEVVGLLAGASCGASSEARDGGLTEVRVYFESLGPARRAREEAGRVFERLGLPTGLPAPCVEQIADEPWVERFQAALEPFDLGLGFRVVPRSARRAAGRPAGRIPIRLAPGRAFGTGQHATTALCAELLEALVRPGARWLDLGCGTAILAVVAAHRGAGEVWALDTDPEAVAVAREVVDANGLADRVTVGVGSLVEAASRRWDGIVCNIELPFFLEHAADLAARLAAGGRLIVSGFLDRDAELVADAVRRAGLRPAAPRTRGEWAALEATRDAEP